MDSVTNDSLGYETCAEAERHLYLTELGSFTLIVEGRFGGEYYSPLPLVGNIKYFCRFCGESFAVRLALERNALWHYVSGSCLNCISSLRHGAYQSFRMEGEQALGFAPTRLLAEEFYFNSKEYANGNAESSSRPSPSSPSLTDSRRRQTSISASS